MAANLVDRYPDAPLNFHPDVCKYTSAAKWLQIMDLSPCVATSEAGLDDRADNAGEKARALRPSITILKEVLVTKASNMIASVVKRDHLTTFEGRVSNTSHKLFHQSKEVEITEERLFTGERQTSVLATEDWFRTLAARYLHLARRRELSVSLSNSRIHKSILWSVPSVVKDEFWRRGSNPSVGLEA